MVGQMPIGKGHAPHGLHHAYLRCVVQLCVQGGGELVQVGGIARHPFGMRKQGVALINAQRELRLQRAQRRLPLRLAHAFFRAHDLHQQHGRCKLQRAPIWRPWCAPASVQKRAEKLLEAAQHQRLPIKKSKGISRRAAQAISLCPVPSNTRVSKFFPAS